MTRRRRGTGTITWHAHSGRWLAQAPRFEGHRPSKYFPGNPPPGKPPTEAQRWLTSTIAQMQEQRFTHSGRLTVGEQVQEWFTLREPKLWPSTRRTYRALLPLMSPVADTRLDQLKPNHVQAWLNGLDAADKAPKTVAMVRNILSQAMEAAVNWERISRNPVASTETLPAKARAERRAWSPAQAKVFLAAIEDDRMQTFWITMLHTGMRQGEVRGLKWSDVDFSERTILLATSQDDKGKQLGPTKTRTKQRLPMTAVLERALLSHRDAQPRAIHDDWVFRQDTGRPLSGDVVRRAFRRACTTAGLDPIRPHELRHTAATLMHEAGVPPLIIASILGHATVKQLESVYFHASDPERRKALEALSERLAR